MPGNGVAAGASYGDLLVTSLLVLGAVCVAAFIAVRVFGRLLATGRARGTHLLDVVARVPLEPRRSLYVVEVAGKTLLVGTSEMGLSVLSELDGSEVKSRVQAQQSFGELVRAAWQRRKARGAGERMREVDAEALAGSPSVRAVGSGEVPSPPAVEVVSRPAVEVTSPPAGEIASRPAGEVASPPAREVASRLAGEG
jgi:flagellar biogenesis protein FliO